MLHQTSKALDFSPFFAAIPPKNSKKLSSTQIFFKKFKVDFKLSP
jgi:hypothetical protein